MTLLFTFLAAVISTVAWYAIDKRSEYKLSALCWMFWGAALMWFVDFVFEYREVGAEIFAPTSSEFVNDAYLGLWVIALAGVIWTVILLYRDPKGVIRKMLAKG